MTPDAAATEALARQVRLGDRRALAQAITLIESTRPDHREAAGQLLEHLTPHSGNSIRIGITGAPGVGKSTFVEAIGNHIIDQGHRIAVLPVDPSSTLSGGSILGDKTRMQQLARRPQAFIRPSPTGRVLGGVTRRTREAILVCEAAGHDVIAVETVGVGQSETAVAEMTDVFVLLLPPGGGDELQGIKRGIVELSDIILVNKADGELEAVAHRAASEYAHALGLLRQRSAHWTVPVGACSAIEGTGVAEAWERIGEYRTALEANGEIAARRAEQARSWMWAETAESLLSRLREDGEVAQRLPDLEEAVMEGQIAPTVAASTLLRVFLREG